MRTGRATLLTLAGLSWLAAACAAAPAAGVTVQATQTVPTALPTPLALAPTAAPSPTPRALHGVVTIEAAEQYFNPDKVTVSAGTTVVWNDVQGTHDMVAEDKTFASAVLFEGGSYAHTFNVAGHYHYVCTLHLGAGMWGDIDVEP